MAPIGRVDVPVAPDYRHEADAIVPLRYPFVLAGQMISEAAIVPPTLDALEWLGEPGHAVARHILAAVTTLTLPQIGALRWPDIELILAAARTSLPPDLVARLEGEAPNNVIEPQNPNADDGLEPAEAASGTVPLDDVSDELGLSPADFAITV